MVVVSHHLSDGQPGLPLQLRARGRPLHPPPALSLLLHPLLPGRLHLHLSHHRLLGNTRLSQKGTRHCIVMMLQKLGFVIQRDQWKV